MSTTTAPSQVHGLASTIVDDIHAAVRRVIGRERLSRTASEDLEQLTWVRLLERLGSAAAIGSPTAFAVGIARNVVREQRGQERRRRQLEAVFALELVALTETSRERAADDVCEARERDAQLGRARRALSAADRWLIDGRFLEEASYADLLPRYSRRFGGGIGTEEGLRTALFHARRRLVRALERDAGAHVSA